MDEDLISKKDLLELTGISYGQLYRWKRKGLLPEDWFIRKSTFTGQETFFPKSKMLSRIERIQNMKEENSLDELADVFSPSLASTVMRPDELCSKNIVAREILSIYQKFAGESEELSFNDMLSVYILGKLLTNGEVGLDEGKATLDVLQEGLMKFREEPFELILFRKMGVFSCFIAAPPCRLCIDKGLRILDRISINSAIEELKLKLM
jgi:hypothetical protein